MFLNVKNIFENLHKSSRHSKIQANERIQTPLKNCMGDIRFNSNINCKDLNKRFSNWCNCCEKHHYTLFQINRQTSNLHDLVTLYKDSFLKDFELWKSNLSKYGYFPPSTLSPKCVSDL